MFNVSENSEIIKQEKEARNLVASFKLSAKYKLDRAKVEPLLQCQEILEQVPTEIPALPTSSLATRHAVFLIREQIDIYSRIRNNLIILLKL